MAKPPKEFAEIIQPAAPNKEWLAQFMTPSLLETKGYALDAASDAIKLDQNESPFDWPAELKERVLARLLAEPWNRYPVPYSLELEALVAAYAGVPRDAVVLSAGSNQLLTLTLSTLTRNIKGKVVVARPSFSLYEAHCRYEGIPYEPWPLNADLEYDVNLLPELPTGSLVVFASPNNPVGNVLKRQTLRELLTRHPSTLFFADEAYFEFAKEPYTELLAAHANLLIVRTMSKALGAAGVRLGYLVGSPVIIQELKKVVVPFLLNRFALVCASEVLRDQEALAAFNSYVAGVIRERERVYAGLCAFASRAGFSVKNTEANFLLLRWPTAEASRQAYTRLKDAGVLIRNVSGQLGMSGSLRMTIGTKEENDQFLRTAASVWAV